MTSPPKGTPEKPSVIPQTPTIVPAPQVPAMGIPLPSPPQVRTFDWQARITPLVEEMQQQSHLALGTLLLVEPPRNQTNGVLPVTNITEILKSTLQQQGHFQLVPEEQVRDIKQRLGISEEDSLSSRTKAISLARALNAQYVLYSVITGQPAAPQLDAQLLAVNSGEIVWSGMSALEQ